MPVDLPDHCGPYLIRSRIGSGGMGSVYRAHDPRLQREVAVKVLHRNLDASSARERFLREARIVSSLNHPNICTVFDIGEQDGDPYLVMELLQGEALKDRIARGPVPESDLREIALRVGLALQAAHAGGVIHRDIKPANIFLVADGSGTVDVKVLDFGLAKSRRDATLESTGLTRAGSTVGTVEYMSPEQACGETLDARTDLFSLGAVLYEMATGELPFPGATSAMIFSALLNHEPRPMRKLDGGISADLDAIVRGLLVKERNSRTQSAAELLDALSRPAVATSSREEESAGSWPGAEPPHTHAQRPMPETADPVREQGAHRSGGSAVPSLTAAQVVADETQHLPQPGHRALNSTAGEPESREAGDPRAANHGGRGRQSSRQQSRGRSAAHATLPERTRARQRSKAPWIVLLGLLLLGSAVAIWLGMRAHQAKTEAPVVRGSAAATGSCGFNKLPASTSVRLQRDGGASLCDSTKQSVPVTCPAEGSSKPVMGESTLPVCREVRSSAVAALVRAEDPA